MTKSKIPQKVLKEFAYMTKNFKGRIVELGVKHEIKWFMFQFSEPAVVGFPQVRGIDENGKLHELFGHESLELTSSFVKD